MIKKILLVFIAFTNAALSFGQGFKVVGSDLRDANGNSFIIKGMNVPLAWYVDQVNNNIGAIRTSTGANCLRIIMETSTPDNAWQTAVQKCIENKIIPIVELHNVTGSNDAGKLNEMATWWASKASFLTRTEIARYILINIANEWGDWYMASPNHDPNSSVWRDAYISSINTIRNAGIKTTLVIDAPGYGQDNKVNVLLKYGAEVKNNDPEKNVIYSLHLYCEWAKNGNSSVSSDLPAVKNAGLPVIVGEFGYQHATDGSCDIDEELIMSTCQANNIGWLAWSWKGNGSEVGYLDLANAWDGSSLTGWGNTVVNGKFGTKTGVTASVFLPSANKLPTASITSPQANAIFTAPASFTINASASDEDGSVSRVEFLNGSTVIFTDYDAPYSYTWSSVAEGSYNIKAIAYDNVGGNGSSAAINVIVQKATIGGNQIQNGEFDNGTNSWSINNSGGANGTLSVTGSASMLGNNALKISSTNPGTADWHVQVSQHVSIIAGRKYTISFIAKADADRTMALGLQMDHDPWTFYYGQQLQLTTSNKVFTFTYQPTATDPIAELKFYTGLSNTCVYIDKVIFGEEGEITSNIFPRENKTEEAYVYPNPFENTLRLVSDNKQNSHMQINLIDLNGKSVYKNDLYMYTQEITLPENINHGIYLLILFDGIEQKLMKVEKR